MIHKGPYNQIGDWVRVIQALPCIAVSNSAASQESSFLPCYCKRLPGLHARASFKPAFVCPMLYTMASSNDTCHLSICLPHKKLCGKMVLAAISRQIPSSKLISGAYRLPTHRHLNDDPICACSLRTVQDVPWLEMCITAVRRITVALRRCWPMARASFTLPGYVCLSTPPMASQALACIAALCDHRHHSPAMHHMRIGHSLRI